MYDLLHFLLPGFFVKVKVRSGDSLWYYSQLFMIPIDLIKDSNPTVDYTKLSIGEEIRIPSFTTYQHVLTNGDTVWELATSQHIAVDALLLLNQTINPNNLKVGETLTLPNRVVSTVVLENERYLSSELLRDIKKLREIYPFIKVNTIGRSVLGHPLTEIRLGNGKRTIHINAAFHANEWITTMVLMAILNDYLLSLSNSKPLRGINMLPFYNSVVLSIVPMVNPDGVDLVLQGPADRIKNEVVHLNKGSNDFTGWKANIRGVDLNNQYPANWEVEKERKEPKSPSPRDFPGKDPLTEPEAIAMANLAKQNLFDCLIALHTQGEEFYWGYERLEPIESERIAAEFARVSGYKSVRYIDSHAGYKDWFIQEFRRPGFTIELGKGINPLPLSQFDTIYQKMLGIFIAALYM